MSVQSQIDRIITAVGNAYRKVSERGGTVPASQTVANLATAIDSIPAGGATKPYIEEIYDSDGNLIDVKMHGYTKIRDHIFEECHSLSLASLPDEIVSIGSCAFFECENLALTSLPLGVTYIGYGAFIGCENLALTSLPDGITSIGTQTFYFCTNLALTSIPAGVTDISYGAFYGCTGLTELTFLGTPTGIAPNSFQDCTNLTTINVPWAEGAVANAPWGATNATIHYNYTGG